MPRGRGRALAPVARPAPTGQGSARRRCRPERAYRRRGPHPSDAGTWVYEPDLDDLPDEVRTGLRIHPVADVAEVLELALEPAEVTAAA